MINIAIIDDDQAYAEALSGITSEYFKGIKKDYKIKTYHMANELLWDIEDGHYFEIYLLDIEMPDVNGLELAHQIRQKYDEPYILFITAFSQYCMDGYRYHAWRFILKESVGEMLPMAFDDLLEKISVKKEQYYVIETHYKADRINYADICYLDKDGKYTIFHTLKKAEYRERKPLSIILEKLNDRAFLQTDRGYVVNIRNVLKIEQYQLTMRDGTKIPVSIPVFQEVKKKICAYWREMNED